jgi:hypothetical protein
VADPFLGKEEISGSNPDVGSSSSSKYDLDLFLQFSTFFEPSRSAWTKPVGRGPLVTKIRKLLLTLWWPGLVSVWETQPA